VIIKESLKMTYTQAGLEKTDKRPKNTEL
jgi:hypothetical protein